MASYYLLFLCFVVALSCCTYGTIFMCLDVCIFPTEYQINSNKMCGSTKTKRHVFRIIYPDPAESHENVHLHSQYSLGIFCMKFHRMQLDTGQHCLGMTPWQSSSAYLLLSSQDLARIHKIQKTCVSDLQWDLAKRLSLCEPLDDHLHVIL